MQNVKNILDSLLQSSVPEEAWKLNLIKNWPTIIGSLHDKVSLQKVNGTSVVLGVYDSSWIQELYLLSKLILKKINSHLDRPRIETLRFQCVETSTQSSDRRSKATKNSIANKKKELQPKKLAESSQNKNVALKPEELQALKKIRDPQLSQALQGFLQKCQQ